MALEKSCQLQMITDTRLPVYLIPETGVMSCSYINYAMSNKLELLLYHNLSSSIRHVIPDELRLRVTLHSTIFYSLCITSRDREDLPKDLSIVLLAELRFGRLEVRIVRSDGVIKSIVLLGFIDFFQRNSYIQGNLQVKLNLKKKR